MRISDWSSDVCSSDLLEGRVQRRLLAVGEFQQAAEQQRAHFTPGGAQRMTGFAMDIPQGHRISPRFVAKPGHAVDTPGDPALGIAGGSETAQVTPDICGEYRHAGIT